MTMLLQWFVTSSVLILAVLLLRRLLGGRISPRVKYALWAVVLVRLDAVPLPAGVRAYLDACLAGVGAEPRPEWGVRFVPCQTVAGHCLLPALPAALGSNGRKQDGIYAAFCDMPPPPGGWTALVSAETAALLGK